VDTLLPHLEALYAERDALKEQEQKLEEFCAELEAKIQLVRKHLLARIAQEETAEEERGEK